MKQILRFLIFLIAINSSSLANAEVTAIYDFQGTKNDGLSMGPSMGTNGGGGGVVNNYYNEPKEKGGGVTMQQVIDAISNIKMLVDGKELSATMRTADSFRRG